HKGAESLGFRGQLTLDFPSVTKAANNWLDYIKLVTFNLIRTFLISFSYQNIPQKRVLII
ncbi:hypothetical protein, partial [Parabacteroides merdae]|uniref:hypothetical protein n=1 Tax=Parabacteroides merdae TaxID=46503 RepID=UPI00232CB03A